MSSLDSLQGQRGLVGGFCFINEDYVLNNLESGNRGMGKTVISLSELMNQPFVGVINHFYYH